MLDLPVDKWDWTFNKEHHAFSPTSVQKTYKVTHTTLSSSKTPAYGQDDDESDPSGGTWIIRPSAKSVSRPLQGVVEHGSRI